MDISSVILARKAPLATTETLLYQVTTSSNTFIEGITICNRSGSAQSFRISVSPQNTPTALADYVYYDLPIKANDTFLVELDFTITNDAIRVYASSADLSFILYGHI